MQRDEEPDTRAAPHSPNAMSRFSMRRRPKAYSDWTPAIITDALIIGWVATAVVLGAYLEDKTLATSDCPLCAWFFETVPGLAGSAARTRFPVQHTMIWTYMATTFPIVALLAWRYAGFNVTPERRAKARTFFWFLVAMAALFLWLLFFVGKPTDGYVPTGKWETLHHRYYWGMVLTSSVPWAAFLAVLVGLKEYGPLYLRR